MSRTTEVVDDRERGADPRGPGPAASDLAHPGGAPSPLARVIDVVDAVRERSGRLTMLGFLVIVGSVAVLRSGLRGGATDIWIQLGRQFPEPVANWRATSVVGPALAHVTGVDSVRGWVVLHTVAVVVALATVCALVYRSAPDRELGRLAIVWVSLGPLPPVLLQKIGSYDPYTTAAVAVLVLARGRVLALAAGAVLGLANAEQGALGIVAAACAAVALAGDHQEPLRASLTAWWRSPLAQRLALGATGLVVARAALAVHHATSTIDVPSRGGSLDEFARQGARSFLGAGGAGVYAWFGAAWVLVAVCVPMRRGGGRRLALLGAGLIAVPALATVLSIDGTRVFTMVSLPAFLLLLTSHVDTVARASAAVRTMALRLVTAVAIVSPLLPALVSEPGGAAYFVMPWAH